MHNKYLFLLLATIIAYPAFSQSAVQKYLVKLNATAFVEYTAHLQYEAKLGRKKTFAIGLGLRPKAPLPFPFKGYIESIIDHPGVIIDEFKISGIIFTPEMRYYLSRQGAFHGFYLAPYLRAGFYDMSGPVRYISQSSATGRKSVVFSGKFSTASLGIMTGYMFNLTKKLHLDVWIIGASFGYSASNLRGDTDLSDTTDREGLSDVINAINIPLTTIEHSEDAKGASVKTHGGVFGGRGLGLCLGVSF